MESLDKLSSSSASDLTSRTEFFLVDENSQTPPTPSLSIDSKTPKKFK